MNGKILNSPIRPQKTLQPHHIRHLISRTLVFLLGIAAIHQQMNMVLHARQRCSPAATRGRHRLRIVDIHFVLKSIPGQRAVHGPCIHVDEIERLRYQL